MFEIIDYFKKCDIFSIFNCKNKHDNDKYCQACLRFSILLTLANAFLDIEKKGSKLERQSWKNSKPSGEASSEEQMVSELWPEALHTH